ncbi:hypothetical protein [Tabrizicola fusiformis]|uniref:hypothetical protein n=1 Tax=Tabrizicola sp. SY72 TaxID=2741673 RepID=UPI001573CD05|nr:hypothetical protein [Tabrizicola sp. SY72]NTT86105.1 hypothetical protein [Tabrizicola sp. SY72]
MSGKGGWPWSVLGLEGMPTDRADLRRAYARALKQIDQATDIEGFAALREAYDAALAMRDTRDAANAAQSARRATAKTVPAEPLPQTVPPASPAEFARQTEEAAFALLLQTTLTPKPDHQTEQRLAYALDSPFMADPQRKAALGRAIAGLISDSFALQPEDDPELARAFTPALMQRLDREFAWLSDYAAFDQAFPFETALQHEMLRRAHNGVLPQAKPHDRPSITPFGRIARILVWMTAFIFLIAVNGFDLANWPLLGVAYGIAGLIVWLGVFPLHLWIHVGFQRRYHRLTSVLLTLLTILSLAALPPVYGAAKGWMFVIGAVSCLVLLCLMIALGPKGSPWLEDRLQSFARRMRVWR